MALARPIRLLLAGCVILSMFLVFKASNSSFSLSKKVDSFENGLQREPLLDRMLVPCFFGFIYCLLTAFFFIALEEPDEPLRRAEGDAYAPDNPNSSRINATLLSLVRNEELDEMVKTMRDLERTWNNKFNYPWTFFNDKPFTDEFKKRTQAETNAKCSYGTYPTFTSPRV